MYVNLKDAQEICFSSCEHCQTSCCDGGRFILAPLVLEDFSRVYENFLIAFAWIDEKLRVVMLISNKKKPCQYYKDKRCTIYASRPPACVMYPFTPFYDEVLIDTACDAVGFVGFSLQQPKEKLLDKIHPNFYDERFLGFKQKLEETESFLTSLKGTFTFLYELEGIRLMSYNDYCDNLFLEMHQKSLIHLQKWL